jgi:integrase
VKAGGAAAYWVPLLGLYTGARQSELCQLRIEDVTTDPDMGLTVTILADAGDEDEDSPETTTKGETGRRRTPIWVFRPNVTAHSGPT